MQADRRHQDVGLGMLSLLGSGSFGLYAAGWAGTGAHLGGMLVVYLQNRWTTRTGSPLPRLRTPRPWFFRIGLLLATIITAVLVKTLNQEQPPGRSIDLFLAAMLAVEAVTCFRRAVLAGRAIPPG